MGKALRRSDKKMEEAKTLKILQEGQYGILSTLGEDGYPYGVPLSYVLMDNAIYFHCALEGHKIDNILNCSDKVSFCVVAKAQIRPAAFNVAFESVVVFGKAAEALGEKKEAALFALLNKYSSDYLIEGQRYIEKDGARTRVFSITLEQVTGKQGLMGEQT